MNIQKPETPAHASNQDISQITSDSVSEIHAESAKGEFSAIGLLCDGILALVSDMPVFTDVAKASIADRISTILNMFSESEHKANEAKLRIKTLKADLRRVTEQFAVLKQKHFGQSSEVDNTPSKSDQDIDDSELANLLADALEDEPEEMPKGKRARKLPGNIEPQVFHHYPDSRECCTCGCEMNSISTWSSTRVRLVPEHIKVVKDFYHTFACNHEVCKENKPVSLSVLRPRSSKMA